MDEQTFLFKRDISPIKQAAAVGILIIIFNVIAYLFQFAKINPQNTLPWEISLSLILFFALGNTVFFLNAKDKNKYWTHSIFSYIVLVALSIGTATIISGYGINDSGSIKWIYFVISFGYLVFISIIGMIRKLVEIAIKQDKDMREKQ